MLQMDPTTDLETTVAFVIRRIEEQAMRSGQPLNEEQRSLLNDLPRTPTLPETGTAEPDSLTLRMPRDLAYERLCALAKAAHKEDIQLNPEGHDWHFAAAVAKLNRHPMSWLLRWAGVKTRRPWWDGCLLFASAFALICCWMALIIPAVSEPRTRLRWLGVGVGCVAIVLMIGFATRRIEEWQLKQAIERYRRI